VWLALSFNFYAGVSTIGAEGAGYASASPSKHFIDKIDQIWAKLLKFGRNLSKVEAILKQNLVKSD